MKRRLRSFSAILPLSALLPLSAICYSLFFTAACHRTPPALTVFYAAAFEPVMHDLLPRVEKTLERPVTTETGGSGNLLRKITEPGRSCDLMLVADGSYFHSHGGDRFAWRLDFATDALVLAVGSRAPRSDEAGRDWVPVLLDPAVRLGRSDEGISPSGSRTLRLAEIKEQSGATGLVARLRSPAVPVVADVGTLAARLKANDLDYAFLYRATCLMQDIRFIPLEKENSPPLFSLSIPDNAANPEAAVMLARTLLTSWRDVWEEKGFAMIKPKFFGDRVSYSLFRDIAEYGGPME